MEEDFSQPGTVLHNKYVFLMVKTDIPSCQETAVTDIVLILHNVSLCQRAWVISKQSRVIRDLLNQACTSL